jgi:hypothetical protein
MFRWSFCATALTLILALLSCRPIQADAEKGPQKETPSFSLLRSPAPEAARSQALEWLKGIGKTDAVTLRSFEPIWTSDRPLLEKVSATLALGDPAAAELLKQARDPETPAPTSVPSRAFRKSSPVM